MKNEVFDFNAFEEPDYSGDQVSQDYNLYGDSCGADYNHHNGLYQQIGFGSGCYQRKKVGGIYDSTIFDDYE